MAMSDEGKVVVTPDAIAFFNKVQEWLESAPQTDEFWVGKVVVDWGHSEEPIANFVAEDNFWLVEITNG